MAQKIMAQKIETTTIYTEQQMEYLNKMHAVCERAKELKETCVGYVIAGYDEAGEGYCYCGEGNGYKGAPLRPSCIFAVVFDDKDEAERKAKRLIGYRNGAGHKIKLHVEDAWYYFECVYSQMLGIIETAKEIFNEINNNME